MNRKNRYASVALGSVISFLTAQPALAQTQTPDVHPVKSAPQSEEADPDKRDSDIVVTGTNLRQSAADSTVAVKVVEKSAFDEAGYTDLADALSELPGVTMDIGLSNEQNSIRDNGLSTIELRGAGRNRTLTLIDGRRTVSDASTGNAVNLATLPAFFIERVEMTTGGASASYGSDAIAGVVNLITESDLEQLKARVQGTATNDGGGDSQEYSIAYGRKFFDNRLYLMGAVTYETRDELRGTDRDWALRSVSYSQSTNALTSPALGTNIPGGRFRDGAFFYDASGQRTGFVTALNGYDTRPEMTLASEREILSTAFKAKFDVSERLTILGSLLYSSIDTFTARPPQQSSNSDSFGQFNEFTVGRIPLTNPLIPANIRAGAPSSGITFTRRLMELGTLGARNHRESLRGWLTVAGTFSDWSWDVSYGYGRSSQDQSRENGINRQNLNRALNIINVGGQNVCADAVARAAGCVPIDLFGLNSITPAAADWIRHDARYTAVNTQHRVAGNITGAPFSLPAGPVHLASGFEMRRDALKASSDHISTQGLSSWGYAPSTTGSLSAVEGYVEAALPLIRDTPLIHRLGIDGAVRIAAYDRETIGQTFSYRLGGRWSPIRDITFRASYARAERAPTIGELFDPPRTYDDAGYSDLCNGTTAANTGVRRDNCRKIPIVAAEIAATGVFTGPSNDRGTEGGNPDLRAEVGRTITAGIVINPRFARNFILTADYYDIKVDGVIESIAGGDTQALCYNDTNFPNEWCDRIHRDEAGNITNIDLFLYNGLQMTRRGIDVFLSYKFDLNSIGIPGKFRLDGNYSRVLELERIISNEGLPEVIDGLNEVEDAANKGQARITWSTDRVLLGWTTTYIGSVYDERTDVAEFRERGIVGLFERLPAYWRHDFRLNLTPSLRNPNLRMFFNVRNVFNKYGPFLPTGTASGNANNYNSSYGVLGRVFVAGVQTRF